MLLRFFDTLRRFGVPISTRELLDLLAVLRTGIGFSDQEAFYFLGRLTLVKDERFFDRYDRAFKHYFDGLGGVDAVLDAALPAQQLEGLLRELLDVPGKPEQTTDALGRALAAYHQQAQKLRAPRAADDPGAGDGGGDAATGQAERGEVREGNSEGEGEGEGECEGEGEGERDGEGEEGEDGDGQGEEGDGGEDGEGREGDSETGADGQAEQGLRKGQKESRLRTATRIWEDRLFADLDDDVELGTRTFKIALRRLRKFARTGADEELDLAGTIAATARNGGWLDIRMQRERRNTVKVLLLLDIGGSMDEHVRVCEQLFSAARTEFKHLVPLYFHNFVYEHVWSAVARHDEHRVALLELVRKYGTDYKVVFVGDANMGLHELLERGGCLERYNEQPGVQWFAELHSHFRRVVWINPAPVAQWRSVFSTVRIERMLDGNMFALTNEGLTGAMRALAR